MARGGSRAKGRGKTQTQQEPGASVPAILRRRIHELVGAGMRGTRAKSQARAEFNKGVLAAGCCVMVGRKRRTRTKGTNR